MAGPFTMEKEHYARMLLLVNEKGTEAFQKTLDYHATHKCKVASFDDVLQNKKAILTQLRGKGKPITAVQWNQLYPGRAVNTKELDITLCFILLKQFTLCGLKAPITGWDSEPAPTDTSLEASLAQLKYIRNIFAHSQKPELSTHDFGYYFQKTSDAINNISSKLPAGMVDTTDIMKYKTDPLTPQVIQQSEDIFKEWKGQDAQIEEKLEQIELNLGKKIDEQKDAIAMKVIAELGEEEKKRKNKEEEEAKSDDAASWTLPDPELLKDLEARLKDEYQCKYSEVSFVQGEDKPRTFDVDSDLYKPVQYMPVEVSCSHFSKQNISATARNAGTTYQLSNDSDDRGNNKRFGSGMKQNAFNANHTSDNQETTDLGNTKSTKEITSLLTKECNPKKYPILVEAEAGVGKTTLLHHLALSWAKGDCEELKKFQLVLLIHLRRVKSTKIEEIICDDLNLLPASNKMLLKNFLERRREKVLYLIDGLDEVKLHEENELLQKMREPGNHVICTSRPILQPEDKGSPHGMEKRLHVKLLGFSDDTIHSYIKTYFCNDEDGGQNQAEKILDECRKHMFCKAIMRTPLYTGLICFLWEKHMDKLPDTATQLFNKFLKEKLIIFWSKIGKQQTTIEFHQHPLQKTVPSKIRRFLYLVAKLAFQTLVAGKVVFSFEDVDDCYLSLNEITQLGLFTIEDSRGSVIQFSHKLFHEYFAGLWLVKFPLEIKNLFKTEMEAILSRTHYLHHAFFFAAGMSSESFKSMYGLVDNHKESSKEERELQRKIYHSGMTSQQVDTYVEVFKLQLVFEHGVESAKVYNLKRSTIPIHCSSAHSLAAAFTVLQSLKTECDTMTLIGGGHTDTEQIRCILNECQKAKQITTVNIHGATGALMKELHGIVWPFVKRLYFHKCEAVLDVIGLCSIFPNIQLISYDGNNSNVFDGNSRVNHCVMNDKGVALILQFSSSFIFPSSADKVQVQFRSIDKAYTENNVFGDDCADILYGCKVDTVIASDGVLRLLPNPTQRQWIHTVVLLSFVCLICKDVCHQYPNLKCLYVSIYHHGLKADKSLKTNQSKPVRLIMGIDWNNTLLKHSEHENDTFTVVIDDMDHIKIIYFLEGMPLSVVSTLGMHTDFFCDHRVECMVGQEPCSLGIQKGSKHISQRRQQANDLQYPPQSLRPVVIEDHSKWFPGGQRPTNGQTSQILGVNEMQDPIQSIQQQLQHYQSQANPNMQVENHQYPHLYRPTAFQQVGPFQHRPQHQIQPLGPESHQFSTNPFLHPSQNVRPSVFPQGISSNQKNANLQVQGYQTTLPYYEEPNTNIRYEPFQYNPHAILQQRQPIPQRKHDPKWFSGTQKLSQGQASQFIGVNDIQVHSQCIQSNVHTPMGTFHQAFPIVSQQLQDSRSQTNVYMQVENHPYPYSYGPPALHQVGLQQEMPMSGPGYHEFSTHPLPNLSQNVRSSVFPQRLSSSQNNQNLQMQGYQNTHPYAGPNANPEVGPFQYNSQVVFQQQQDTPQQKHFSTLEDSKHFSPQYNSTSGQSSQRAHINTNTLTYNNGIEYLQPEQAPQFNAPHCFNDGDEDEDEDEDEYVYMCDTNACEHKKEITQFLKSFSCFPQIILGPLLVSSDLCDYIVSLLQKTPMCVHTWTLEGQCIKGLLDPEKASLDDYFLTDTQWLNWEQFKVKCQEIHFNDQLACSQGKEVESPKGVIRMSKGHRR